jgi:hypothetical protein
MTIWRVFITHGSTTFAIRIEATASIDAEAAARVLFPNASAIWAEMVTE